MSTDAPVVSVIVPTYNRPQLLARALQSVLRQSYTDFEIIVVDDGSVASVSGVVAGCEDPRIRLIRHERNRGLPATRNTGIRAARGQYIAFLDDDDLWHANKLEIQLREMGDCEAILCASQSEAGHNNQRFPKRFVELNDLRRGNPFDPSGLLVRAAILRELPFDTSLPRGIGEDWDIFIRLAARRKLAYVAQPLLIYSDGNHSRITNEKAVLSISELESRMRVIEKHRDFFAPFWYRFHKVAMLLSYWAKRDKKFELVRYATREYGPTAVAAVFWAKFRKAFNTAVGHRYRRLTEPQE